MRKLIQALSIMACCSLHVLFTFPSPRLPFVFPFTLLLVHLPRHVVPEHDDQHQPRTAHPAPPITRSPSSPRQRMGHPRPIRTMGHPTAHRRTPSHANASPHPYASRTQPPSPAERIPTAPVRHGGNAQAPETEGNQTRKAARIVHPRRR
jgi:hypothetical protein